MSTPRDFRRRICPDVCQDVPTGGTGDDSDDHTHAGLGLCP